MLSACQVDTAGDGSLELVDPALDWRGGQGWLQTGIDWNPPPRVIEALENGVEVPLTLMVRVSRHHGLFASVDETRRYRFTVRYLPMVRNFQLTRPGDEALENFPRLSMLTDALAEPGRWPLGLDEDARETRRWQVQARVDLDRSGLPSPMRLPAWFDPQWRGNSGWTTWIIEPQDAGSGDA